MLSLHCADQENSSSEKGSDGAPALGSGESGPDPLPSPGLSLTTSPQYSRELALLFSRHLWWWSVVPMAGIGYFVFSVGKFRFG